MIDLAAAFLLSRWPQPQAGTPVLIRFLVKYGQFIRQDGRPSTRPRRGTPTMGGALILATVVAWLIALFLSRVPGQTGLCC